MPNTDFFQNQFFQVPETNQNVNMRAGIGPLEDAILILPFNNGMRSTFHLWHVAIIHRENENDCKLGREGGLS